MIVHAVDSCEFLGPLEVYNTIHFESVNHLLNELIYGMNKFEPSLLVSFQMNSKLEFLKNLITNTEILKVLNKLTKNSQNNWTKCNNGFVVGLPVNEKYSQAFKDGKMFYNNQRVYSSFESHFVLLDGNSGIVHQIEFFTVSKENEIKCNVSTLVNGIIKEVSFTSIEMVIHLKNDKFTFNLPEVL
jgi:hypothetical protein